MEAEALECARRIAAGTPLAHRWHKRAALRLRDPAPLSAAEEDAAYESFASEDFHRGVEAFLAKRAPAFRGR